jgi:hypothetical protein
MSILLSHPSEEDFDIILSPYKTQTASAEKTRGASPAHLKIKALQILQTSMSSVEHCTAHQILHHMVKRLS